MSGRASEKARRSLDRIRSFEAWAATLNEQEIAAHTRAFGSPRNLYDTLRRALEREIENPTPRVVRAGPVKQARKKDTRG